jgi:hypothetical protein
MIKELEALTVKARGSAVASRASKDANGVAKTTGAEMRVAA